MSLRELEIEAALPLAKYGRLFRTPWLDEYFRKQPWYKPTGFDENHLRAPERARVEVVRKFIASFSDKELAEREAILRKAGQQVLRMCPRAVVAGGGTGTVPERLAVQYFNGELVLWDLATHRHNLINSQISSDLHNSATFAREGQLLFAFENSPHKFSPAIVAWNTRTLQRVHFDPDWPDTSTTTRYLLAEHGPYATTTDSTDQVWELYRLDDECHVADLPAPGNARYSLLKLAVSNDLSTAIGVGLFGGWVWDLSEKKSKTPRPFWPGEERVRDADLSRDGRLIAALPGWTHRVTILTAHDLAIQRTGYLPFEPRYVQLSDDGRLVLVGNAETLIVYDVATGKIIRSRSWGDRCKYHAGRRATFLRDSRHLAIAGDAGGLTIVDLQSETDVELRFDEPLVDAKTDRVEAALLERARGSQHWKSEPSLRDSPFAARPELLAQRLSRSEVLAEVKNDTLALNPLFALIYARRGRIFNSPRWKKFATAQAWYHPDPGYTEAKLTAVDRANLALLTETRARLDRRGPRGPADPASLAARSAFPGCPTDATLRRSTDERGIETYACEKASATSKTGRELHGPSWRWLPTGRLLEQRNYENGLEQGPFVIWFWTGARRRDGEFIQGQRQGRHRVFYVSGAVAEDATYDHGQLDGTRLRGFDNGKPALEANYVRGVPNGAWTTFYDNDARAISLTFRDGKTVGNVENFALGGRPWQKGNLHEPCGHGCTSELGHLDIESLPPIPPEPCRDGVVGAAGAWPRGVIGALVAASRKVFDDNSNCSVLQCAPSVSISCAPELDGKPGAEVMAVIACRIPLKVDCPGCAPPNIEYADVAANVVLSPPTPARANWAARGLVSCREASDLEGDPRSQVQNYLRLPDGEGAVLTLDSASNSDDGRD